MSMRIRKRNPNIRFHRTPDDSNTSNKETWYRYQLKRISGGMANLMKDSWLREKRLTEFSKKICDWIKKSNETQTAAKMRSKLMHLQKEWKVTKRTQGLPNISRSNLKDNKAKQWIYFHILLLFKENSRKWASFYQKRIEGTKDCKKEKTKREDGKKEHRFTRNTTKRDKQVKRSRISMIRRQQWKNPMCCLNLRKTETRNKRKKAKGDTWN